MYIHDIDPILVSLGPIDIRYYGLVYALGFLLALYVLIKNAKDNKIKNLTEEKAYDYIMYIMLGSIIGARFFFEVVYNYSSFFSNPIQFFYVWQGGMSIHGGLIGGGIGTYLFVKKSNVKFYDLVDTMVFPLAIALFFGRIANFINGELWGTITNVSWAVKFPAVEGFRHPSQLYESLKNLVIFGSLSYIKTLKINKGTLFWSFLGLYGILRFLVTFFREAETYYFGIGVGQWLSLFMVPIAGYMIYRINKNK